MKNTRIIGCIILLAMIFAMLVFTGNRDTEVKQDLRAADIVEIRNDAYCENLYHQPDAIKKMIEIDCDIEATHERINEVRN
jgi:hypothetical protein